MTTHQIHNIWDLVANVIIWSMAGLYKSISLGIVWLFGLFHYNIGLSLAGFNEGLHTVVLCLAGIVSIATLAPKGIIWYKKTRKRKFSKRTRK